MRIALLGLYALTLFACYFVSPYGELGRRSAAGAVTAAYDEGFLAGGRAALADLEIGEEPVVDAVCTRWWFGAKSHIAARRQLCRK